MTTTNMQAKQDGVRHRRLFLFSQETEVPLRAEYVRKILRIQRAIEGKPHDNHSELKNVLI